MKKESIKLYTRLLLFSTLIATSSCSKSNDPSSNNNNTSSLFDFKTVKDYTLKINYDVPQGYMVKFEVFDQIPVEIDDNGNIYRNNSVALDAGVTDINGAYSSKISLPININKLYVYTTDAGVPNLLETTVSGTTLVAQNIASSSSKNKSLQYDANYKNAKYNKFVNGTAKRLGYWINSIGEYTIGNTNYDLWGRPDYLLTSKATVSADMLNSINSLFPEGGNNFNSKYVKSAIIKVTESAKIDIYLVNEYSSAFNVLAYYCYPTNNPPTDYNSIKDKLVIALPNARLLKYHPWFPAGNTGALEYGEGVRLHYYDEYNNDKGEDFPAGTSVAFMTLNNGYSKYGNELNLGASHFFSDATINADKKLYTSIFKINNKVIFGFEDWTYSGTSADFNDIMLYTAATPNSAITTDIESYSPPAIPGADVKAYSTNHQGYLGFEDNWPSKGDFDLNDVVIKYNSEIQYNINNEVIKSIDTIRLVHSGASKQNSFAYQLSANRSDVTVSISSPTGAPTSNAGLDPNITQATIRLFDRALELTANNTKEQVYIVETKYNNRVSKANFTLPPYNPFITTDAKDIEVHLTNYRPTTVANMALFGTKDDKSVISQSKYYITYSQDGVQMPYAIHIPGNMFVIPRESKEINLYYPQFLNWITSKGTQNTSWFLNPTKN